MRDYVESGIENTQKKKKRKNKHEKIATKRPNSDFDVAFEFAFDIDAGLILAEVFFLSLLFAFICFKGYLGKLCRMLMRANNGMEVIYQAQPM